jgi:hypothetical protein
MTGDKGNRPEEHPTIVEDGVVHLDIRAEEEALDISDLQWDDAPAFLLLWALAGVVFLQFFTRYVLNDSYGWTEEIARYLLIGLAFVGCVMATRKGSHIAIEVFYIFMPRGMRRVLSTVIDVILIGIYAWFAWLTADLSMRTNSLMVSIKASVEPRCAVPRRRPFCSLRNFTFFGSSIFLVVLKYLVYGYE